MTSEPWERETTAAQRLEHFKNCRSCQSHAATHVILEAPDTEVECPDCKGEAATPDNNFLADCSCHGRRFHRRPALG